MKTFFSAIALTLSMIASGLAHAGKSVEVEVNGMFCQMCAYGLSMSLNDLEGVKDANVSYEEHRATIELQDGVAANLDAIKQAVVDSGFTPQKIVVVD